MADARPTRRRVRVERGIYRRSTGVLEVCFKDESGRLRWRTVDGGMLAARTLRNDLAARRARGERVTPNPKLRLGKPLISGSTDQCSTCETPHRSSTGASSTSIFGRGLMRDCSTVSLLTIWHASFGSFAQRA